MASLEPTDPCPWIAVPAHLHCRLLFGSPVCVLVTWNEGSPVHPFNAMTISWLTAIDNHKRFLMSVNKKRHSVKNLLRDNVFALSVAVVGMEDALLSFGSMSGRSCSYCEQECAASDGLAISGCKYVHVIQREPWVVPGSDEPWGDRPRHPTVLPVHGASPAHLICSVTAVLSQEMSPSESIASPLAVVGTDSKSVALPKTQQNDHVLLSCQIDAAFVRRTYWHLGKVFGVLPDATSSLLPAPLAFAGTKTFGKITLLGWSEDDADDALEILKKRRGHG